MLNFNGETSAVVIANDVHVAGEIVATMLSRKSAEYLALYISGQEVPKKLRGGYVQIIIYTIDGIVNKTGIFKNNEKWRLTPDVENVIVQALDTYKLLTDNECMQEWVHEELACAYYAKYIVEKYK